MSTTIIVQQTSLVHLQTCNNPKKSSNIFRSNCSFAPNFALNSNFTQLKCNNHQNVTTKTLLKPFFKPLCESLTRSNPVEFTPEPLFLGGGRAQTGVSPGSGRADFRAWSRRRPGSKSKDKRLIVDLECGVCLKHRYTTERHKEFAKRKTEKEKQNKKKPSISEQNYNKSLSEKEEEKEKRRVKRETEKREVNNPDLLMLFEFCPNCRQPTLHKEVKVRRK